MFLVDTSVWIDLLRDRAGVKRAALDRALGDDDFASVRPLRQRWLDW